MMFKRGKGANSEILLDDPEGLWALPQPAVLFRRLKEGERLADQVERRGAGIVRVLDLRQGSQRVRFELGGEYPVRHNASGPILYTARVTSISEWQDGAQVIGWLLRVEKISEAQNMFSGQEF